MDLTRIIITNIIDVITVYSPKGRTEEMINRKCYGLSFTTEGQITYTLNGKTFVSDRNNAVILPKGQSYTIYGNKEGRFAVINFDCIGFYSDTITVLPVRNTDSAVKDFEQMKNLFILNNKRLSVISIFYNILSNILNTDNSNSNPLMPAIKYLEKNYSKDITNKTLAAQCNISEVYFRKLFSRTYGISPKQYILNMRINKAKQILTEGIIKINAVAEHSGFSNPYHFCRIFKRKTGLTPSEYVKQNKINKI